MNEPPQNNRFISLTLHRIMFKIEDLMSAYPKNMYKITALRLFQEIAVTLQEQNSERKYL